MKTINEDELATNLEKVLDKVINQEPVIIERKNGKSAVLISLEDCHAHQETIHLMATPKNAARLDKAISEVENTHESLNRSRSNKSITIISNS
ncbi:type II toxin-antitoxin system Phd/YefM family antitoxin [Marinomonas spartinae]|uniref:type II toxin-antitoxin system Phd/YefM family antitoxin n=1 Tax=Marinomonas spartinae TaxID=1792290 RepID=UPI0018F244F2|nr:type II toxin-antitoxin system Phd/YefM family antitoxin [Marinomonas spartinae]MBJ7553883.1 type II toxin-antitoxin system Phd/YefM family antitoxin [Marinomonas spartinae]